MLRMAGFARVESTLGETMTHILLIDAFSDLAYLMYELGSFVLPFYPNNI